MYKDIIAYALNKIINETKDCDAEYKQIIYQSASRTKLAWENLKIFGLDSIGMTLEEFNEHCKDKHNVLFLTDKELHNYNVMKRSYEELIEIANELKE